MIPHPDQRVGVFIDTQNMYYSARNAFGRRVNFKSIVTDAVGDRRLIRAIAYVVRTKSADEAPFFEALLNMGIELQQKELQEFESGHKKADWDVGLAVDVVRMLDMLDVVVIVSGDGDFVPLVEYVRGRGRIIEIMAFGETTSSKLIDSTDVYTNLSENKRRFLMGPKSKSHRSQGKKSSSRKSSKKADRSSAAELEEGFFMDAPAESVEDQKTSRGRRLEF